MNKEIKTIKIGNCLIGEDQPTYIIAEIGINHNGDADIARQLIDAAVDAKVDAVKFQKRHLPSLYREDVLNNTLQYEQSFQYMIPILKETELEYEEYLDLKSYCQEKEVEFLCTPFDLTSVDFLEKIGINAYKIASADLTNLELLEYVADQGKPMMVSTGMSYWDEIEKAIKLLRDKDASFALLHCRSVYPVWPREVNLKMINKLAEFLCPVGYSGHDIGITIPLVAASMGASIIEKHITLDKKMRGPDHKISLEPYELKRLVRDIRVADQAIGKGKRFLLRGEILNRELFAKSLMASEKLTSGSVIIREVISVKGPAKGISPNRINDLIGKVIKRDLNKGDFFQDEDIDGFHKPAFYNTFKSKWGVVARFCDFDEMISLEPNVIEFHLAEQDFNIEFKPDRKYTQELVVHGPEYIGDRISDICSGDEGVRKDSILMIQKVIDLAVELAPHFNGNARVVLHPGAMSLNARQDKKVLKKTLIKSLGELDNKNVEILLENLPPYPWYYGGQWKGNYFMDAEIIRSFCEEIGYMICFDLSHAALYCNAKGKDIIDYINIVKPYIRHIHFSDAYGLDGEGVQIGEGDIDMKSVMALFSDYRGSWVPEIWRGHIQKGKGFVEALIKLKEFDL